MSAEIETPAATRLHAHGARRAETLLRRALGWWVHEMAELCRRRPRLLAPAPGPEAHGLDDAATGRPAAPRRRGGRVRIACPPGETLREPLDLPLAARTALAGVLRLRVESGWPIAGAEPLWCAGLSLAPGGRLRGELAMARPESVAPWAAEARRRGFRPAGLGLVALEGHEHLRSGAGAAEGAAERTGARRAALVGAAALGTLVAAYLAFASAERAAARDALAAARNAAGPAIAAQSRLTDLERRLEAIRAARADGLRTIDLLEALAAALPDGAWLRTLAVTPAAVEIEGRAGDAAGVLGALGLAAALGAPLVAAPVTREPRRGEERVAIALDRTAAR